MSTLEINYAPQKSEQCCHGPNGSGHESDLVSLVRTSSSALQAEVSHASKDQRYEEHDVRGQDVDVAEGQPALEDALAVLGAAEAVKSGRKKNVLEQSWV